MSAHHFSFYAPALRDTDATVELSGEEHHHLARVLRMAAGASILATNGRGLSVEAVVESVGATSTTARVARIEANNPRPARLALALSVIERAHFETGFAGCVEAGITELIPLVAARCRARAGGRISTARLERIAIAAMKQSGRAWLPRVEAPVDVETLAARCGGFARVVLADGSSAPLEIAAEGEATDTLAIVGPEAGFSIDEVDRLRAAGARGASLSDHRLRAETAAVVLVAMLAPRGRRN